MCGMDDVLTYKRYLTEKNEQIENANNAIVLKMEKGVD